MFWAVNAKIKHINIKIKQAEIKEQNHDIKRIRCTDEILLKELSCDWNFSYVNPEHENHGNVGISLNCTFNGAE